KDKDKDKEKDKEKNMRVVFRDSSFKDSVIKTNIMQILKQNGINEVVSI
ncbi:MAG: hypothetical protein GXZ15_02350, partial [Campylobacter sp.]|nr:hypothetical protein [Campylobacter sp.]